MGMSTALWIGLDNQYMTLYPFNQTGSIMREMVRFIFFITATLVLATVDHVPAAAQSTTASSQQPNVLILLADDMTYHDLGSYGNPDVHTPNLDRLAEQGVKFKHAYNSAPMCAPTRMSLYTGLHPVRSGAWPNHGVVYPDVRSMPHYLGDLGYRVAIIGKRHEAPTENFPFEYLGGRHHDGGKGIDLDLDAVRTFMEESAERPWALVVASNQPHIPWNRGTPYTYAPESLTLPPYLVDTPDTREALARYYAEISYMDAQMGAVLQHLRDTGQESETIVIFLSEQGSNFPHGKWTCYDTGIRSAALVRWPGVAQPGRVTPAMINYVDVLPTLIEAAGGTPAPDSFDGSSFLDVLTGDAESHNEYVFGIQTSRGIYDAPEAYAIRTVRDRRYRLIWNLNHENLFSNMVVTRFEPYHSWIAKGEAGDPFARKRAGWYVKRPEFELYDHLNDPFELNNLAEDEAYEPELERLYAQLRQWMTQQGDEGTATEMQATERQKEERTWP